MAGLLQQRHNGISLYTQGPHGGGAQTGKQFNGSSSRTVQLSDHRSAGSLFSVTSQTATSWVIIWGGALHSITLKSEVHVLSSRREAEHAGIVGMIQGFHGGRGDRGAQHKHRIKQRNRRFNLREVKTKEVK